MRKNGAISLMAMALPVLIGLQGFSLPTHAADTKKSEIVRLTTICMEDKCGYINARGEVVIPLQEFTGADAFAANGLARVVVDDKKLGFINARGKIVIPPVFEDGWNFAANGLAPVKQNGKWGYVNDRGELVIPPVFEGAGWFAANGLALVGKDGKYGFINAKNEMVIPPKFESARHFAANGLAAVMVDKKWGYIDAKGEILIPPRFEEAHEFAANGLARVRDEESRNDGYINARGEMVIPPEFATAEDFAANGLALVATSYEEPFFINAEGKVAIPVRFEEAESFNANGLARIKENNKFGFINAKGKIVIPPRFDRAGSFDANGLASVSIESDRFVGLINAKGQTVVMFSIVFYGANGVAFIEKKAGKWGRVNAKGQFVEVGEDVDIVCMERVLMNGSRKIIWPLKTSLQTCQEGFDPGRW